MTEQWKPAHEFDGLYECSDKGRVRRVKKSRGTKENKILKQTAITSGYIQFALRKDGAAVRIYGHRLVMATFFGPSKMHVNHINGIKSDNNLSNLEYVTISQNRLHATRILGIHRGENHWNSRLTESDAREIHVLRKAGMLQKDIAAKFGIKRATVAGILTGRQWNYLMA